MDVATLLAPWRRIAAAMRLTSRRQTADMRRVFADRSQMHRYFDAQHAAGYDCFVTRLRDGWEVRSYKRSR
ncbi:MAG: hypothetical protein ABW002_05985 [Xanthomonas sp.]